MRIIFMGTPDFAVESLRELIKHHDILAVFTKPDSPKGRGQHLAFSPVKTEANMHNIPVYQPITLRDDDIAKLIEELNSDVIAVVAYGKILPQNILDIPKYGCVNVHGSLLPRWRGAAPIQQAVLNGDNITGVTTQLMAAGIDTGDILLSKETAIGENETATELFARLAPIGAALLAETLDGLENNSISPIKQDSTMATYAPQLTKNDGKITLDFANPGKAIHHQICGLSEWPCAQMMFDGKRLKIYKSEIAKIDLTEKSYNVGDIIPDKELIIMCGDNTPVKLVEVQYEGSKRMKGSDFLNGRKSKLKK